MESPPVLLDLPDELLGWRVRLRPYRPGDGAALFEAVDSSRDHLRPWLQWIGNHNSVAESETFVRRFDVRWRLREDLPIAITDAVSGRFLGGTGLHHIDWRTRRFEIGYWIRADSQGKGYVTETVELVCVLAFETLRANRVIIRCGVENVRSAAVPERLGFMPEGVLHNEGIHEDGTLFDMNLYAMTREMWGRRPPRA